MGMVIILTHGPTNDGPNPNLCNWECWEVNNCSIRLPNLPLRVISGTGIRHKETAQRLKLHITAYSPLIGNADIVSPDKSKVTLADGTEVRYRDYSCLGDDGELVKNMLMPLLNTNGDSILIADPELLKGCGIKNPKTGAVYQFRLSGTIEL